MMNVLKEQSYSRLQKAANASNSFLHQQSHSATILSEQYIKWHLLHENHYNTIFMEE
jgi:hypothetical protein